MIQDNMVLAKSKTECDQPKQFEFYLFIYRQMAVMEHLKNILPYNRTVDIGSWHALFHEIFVRNSMHSSAPVEGAR